MSTDQMREMLLAIIILVALIAVIADVWKGHHREQGDGDAGEGTD